MTRIARIIAGIIAIAAITGIMAPSANAESLSDDYSVDICAALDNYPVVSTVGALATDMMLHGVTPDDAGTFLVYAGRNLCPEHLPTIEAWALLEIATS